MSNPKPCGTPAHKSLVPGIPALIIACFLLASVSCARGVPAGTDSSGPAAARHADAAHVLRGVVAIHDELVYEVDPEEPLTLLLSKDIYPAEDGYLDGILWLQGADASPTPPGELGFHLADATGRILAQDSLPAIPGPRVFFSLRIPSRLIGTTGRLQVVWTDGETERGWADGDFSIRATQEKPGSGRIRLHIPNDGGAVSSGIPMTVGVPFPRGVLHDTAHIRLTDRGGTEIPLQVRETARWSRFGSIKWLHCDFSVPVSGDVELFLEYGPDIRRTPQSGIRITERPGRPPLIEAGALRFGNGIEYDPADGNGYRTVVTPEGLDGGFVERADGRVFRIPTETAWEIEEEGPEKVVLRRSGWYRDATTGERFCQFVTRFVVAFNSPVVRLFDTWIFTGDAYEDRMAHLGWRFGLNGGIPEGFLTESQGETAWLAGDYLLQYDYDRHKVVRGDQTLVEGDRAPGVAAVRQDGVRMTVGVNDFWENYPYEMEFAEDALYLHQWPRHGRPAVHPVRIEDALRLWFVHEGEELNFALPEDWVEDPDFFYAAPLPDRRRYSYALKGRRETANAQGIAKTQEIWLLFAPEEQAREPAERVMAGLNDHSLRAVVDPEWMCASGALYEIHHQDFENYPAEEQAFELAALAPLEWIERMRFYGKWIWGDMTWDPDIRERGFGLYRGFRKAHQGWPYSWIPYARSGDTRLLRLADAATRYQTDVAFCHYADERVPGRSGEGNARSRGFTIRYRLPWATHNVNPSSRGYIDKCNYLWHSYYMTGYHRARDVVMDWADLTKYEGCNNWGAAFDDRRNFLAPMAGDDRRGSMTLLQAYVEMYEAVFDPWFLAAAHQIARAQLEHFHHHPEEPVPGNPEGRWTGHFWNSGPREFLRFTGSKDYAEFFLHHARTWGGQQTHHAAWQVYCPQLESAAYAYEHTGDEFFLRRVAYWLDHGVTATYTGEPDYFKGSVINHSGSYSPLFLGYWLQYFPLGLAALERAGERPAPLPSGFFHVPPHGDQVSRDGQTDYVYAYRLALLKEDYREIPLILRLMNPGTDFRYHIEDPSGVITVEGRWESGQDMTETTIPAEAPPGVYRVRIQGTSDVSPSEGNYFRKPALFLPLSPWNVPEVLLTKEGAPMRGGGGRQLGATYYFRVPEGLESFTVDFPEPSQILNKITIGNPEGEVAWQAEYTREDYDGPDVIRAEINVPSHLAGRLWRIVIPGRPDESFRLDPRIPALFATDPERWFDPDA